MLFTHQKLSAYPANLKICLGSETLTPQALIKWLGVVLDPRLSFKLHGQAAPKKGTLSLLKLRSLARSGWGLSIKLFLRITLVLVHSRTDYASIAWHTHGKPSALTHALQRLDNTAQRLALGAFQSHPLLYLRQDSNSVSALQRLDSKSDSGNIRLLSLPPSNPASQCTHRIAKYTGPRHQHPLHQTLSSASTISGTLRCPVECIDPSLLPPPCPLWLNLCLESDVLSCLTRARETPSNHRTLVVHCAGAHHPADGAGAAAYAPLPRSSISCIVDNASSSTLYKTELVAVWLAWRLAKSLLTPDTPDIFLFTPSLQVINTLLDPSKPTTGQALRRGLWDYLTKVSSPTAPEASAPQVHVCWCPANQGLEYTEKTLDIAQKASTSSNPSPSTIPLPFIFRAAVAEVKRAKRQLTKLYSPSEAYLTRL